MKSGIEVKPGILAQRPRQRRKLRETILTPLSCSILASAGIFGGISALFIGIVCVSLHSIIPHDQVFDRVGTLLLIAAIPVILIGSIFLDEIEIKK